MAASSMGSKEGSTKTIVAEQISQSVQSTSNLLHLMLQSSPSHAQLMKLPKNLLAKTSTIRNTELVLQQMPQVISSLDAHVESGLQRSDFKEKRFLFDAIHLMNHLPVSLKLLSNMETGKLKSLSRDQHNSQEAPEPVEQHSEVA